MENNPQGTSGAANVEDLNHAIQETHIHIELTKTFYSITPPELRILEEGSASLWKDITLGSLGLGIPCGINGVIEFQKTSTFNSEVFWNCLVGGICLALAIIFGVLWSKSNDSCKQLIVEIKARPKYKMQ